MHVVQAPFAPPVGRLVIPLQTIGTKLGEVAADTALRVSQAVCGLTGHELARHFEPNRISLHCLHCGYNTPGWTITPR